MEYLPIPPCGAVGSGHSKIICSLLSMVVMMNCSAPLVYPRQPGNSKQYMSLPLQCTSTSIFPILHTFFRMFQSCWNRSGHFLVRLFTSSTSFRERFFRLSVVHSVVFISMMQGGSQWLVSPGITAVNCICGARLAACPFLAEELVGELKRIR